MLPVNVSKNLRNVYSSIYDPFFVARNQANVVDAALVFRVLLVVSLIVISVGFVAFGTIVKVSAKKIPCFRQVKKLLKYLDFYSVRHFMPNKTVLVKRRTTLGGTFTLVFWFIGGAIFILFLLELIVNNIFERMTVYPEQALSGNLNTTISGDIAINFWFHGYADSLCNTTTLTFARFNGPITTNYTMFPNMTCAVTIRCGPQCRLDGTQQSIALFWNYYFAQTISIEYEIYIPHFEPNKQFYISEMIVPTSDSEAFRGNIATTITIQLTKSLYKYLTWDFFVYSFFTKSAGQQPTTLVGYTGMCTIFFWYTDYHLASKFVPDLGSTSNSSNYLATPIGLRVTLLMQLNPNVFLIEQDGRTSVLEFFAKVFALVTAAHSAMAILMMSLEFLVLCRSGKARDRMARDNRNAIENIYKSNKVHMVDGRKSAIVNSDTPSNTSTTTTTTAPAVTPADESLELKPLETDIIKSE